MSFLYFIPTETRRRDFALADLPEGLRRVWHDLDGAPWASNPLRSPGPGGRDGTVLTLGPDARYLPDRQQWHRSSMGDYHIGWNKDRLPGPDELIRSRPLDGCPYRMGEHDWLVPILHGPLITIPRAFGFGPNGEVCLQSLPQYSQLLAQSEKWLECVAGAAETMPTFDEWFDFCVGLLAVNYRVGPDECAALQLVRTDVLFIVSVLKICLGINAVNAEHEAQKKTSTPPAG